MIKFSRLILLSSLIFLFLSIGIFANNPPIWKPISPAELAMDKPQVEPDADAEAIFWEIRLDDKKRKKLSYEHYVRVKIFTERGRERFAKFDIPFFKGKQVEDVAARVIKPDGSMINLKPQDIFEREIVRRRKFKIRAKSFAVPGIAPGVIVEYQYRETFKGNSLDGERLFFQRDIPLQKVSYYIRPYKGMIINIKPRNMSLSGVTKMEDGFSVATMKNVPSFKEEPRMPPDEEVKRWAYLSYNSFGSNFNIGFFTLGLGSYFEKRTKPNKLIKQKAAELTANASSDTEKLKKIYDFTQKQIKNLSFAKSGVPSKKLKIKKASDVLKYGAGYSNDIDFLFASLAKAANFNASLVFSGNRSVNFFDPNRDPINASYIHPACIAVMLNGEKNYFNPGTPYLPFGKLIWYEEDVFSLSINKNRFNWEKTPLSPHESSMGTNKGKFTLSENGVLEGKIISQYTGNWAIARRRGGLNQTPEKRLKDYEEELKEWISTGEFSDVKVKNFESADEKLTYSYKVKIPNYATKTGKRIFFQPAVFQYNQKPEFSSSTRVHPIYFRYPWSELDEIVIKLPENFILENFSPPQNVKEKSKLAELYYNLIFDKETNTLTYQRDFYFGGGNRILFPARAYSPIKKLFDLFHKSDSHTLSLKRK